ncbi:unnamed protein product [Bursaphelenchus xylophilus]|uniref:(pine wood nematode) hypothetical protein n=1 Tax=Bursaphelenchus xylophilus TaxID=6326 RepID=A0A1I7SU91_BURXY|nr:unnamed protein product [Bursaphelenchus xylophilus]CAG9107425.1 unnamed protein product [Bursaphelenchus xylophilus]
MAVDPTWTQTPLSSVDSTMSDLLTGSFSPEMEEKHFRRRSSTQFDQTYIHSHPQYSVQGSTSTPSSVGPSSGSASPLDHCIQHSNDFCNFTSTFDPMDCSWSEKSFANDPHYYSSPSFNETSTLKRPYSSHPPSHFSMHTVIADPSDMNAVKAASPFVHNYSDNIISNSEPSPKKKKEANPATKKKVKKVESKGENPQTKPQAKSVVSAITKRRLKNRKIKSDDDSDDFKLPLAELTVEDLKVICRRHNFAISGTKADLFRRLQPIEDQLDIIGILMDAINEEENNAIEEVREVPTTPKIKEKTNKFDVAISDYLMQNQKQIENKQKTSSCSACSCSASSTTKTFLLSNKANRPQMMHSVIKLPPPSNNGATFSYAQMGSGGQFTLECSDLNTTQYVHATVSRSECGSCEDELKLTEAKCTVDELKDVTKSLPQAQDLSDKPLVTAQMLSQHEKLIALQQKKIQDLVQALQHSQKALYCQQKLLETAKKCSKVDPIESLQDNEKQHLQQSANLKNLQTIEQKISSNQRKLTRKEFEIQEEIHIAQAVEDVVRLLKTNRKTALLIVQLIHKFQCDRMKDTKEIIRVDVRPKEVKQTPEKSAEVVVIDESEDDIAKESEKKKKSKVTKPKKPKTIIKKSTNKDKNFAAVMEDIFQTVISDNGNADSESEEKKEPEESTEVVTPEESYSNQMTAPEYHPIYCNVSNSVYHPEEIKVYHSNQFSVPTPDVTYSNQPVIIYNNYEYVPRNEVQVNHPPVIHPPRSQPSPEENYNYEKESYLMKLAEKRRTLCQQLEQIDMQEREMNNPFNEYVESSEDFQQLNELCVYDFETNGNHTDFDDIMDLIKNGEKNKPPVDDSECVQATNAIYQDLMLTDNQFQGFPPEVSL